MDFLTELAKLDPIELYLLVQYLLLNLLLIVVLIFQRKLGFLKTIGIIFIVFILKILVLTGFWLHLKLMESI